MGDWDEEQEAQMLAELRAEHAMAQAEETGERQVPQVPNYGDEVERAREQQQHDEQHHQQQEYQQHNYQQQQEYQHQHAGIPHQDDDPIGHFDARAQQLEQHAVQQQFWNHVTASEDRARQEVGDDYDRACEHLEKGRIRELEKMFPDNSQQAAHIARSHGFQTPAQLRTAVLNNDRIAVATHALQTGQSPAFVYYQLAKERGYKPTVHVTRSFMKHLSSLKGDDFDKAWEKYERAASR